MITVIAIQNDITKLNKDNNISYAKIFEQSPSFERIWISDASADPELKIYENLWDINEDIIKLTWWGEALKWTPDGWITGTIDNMNFLIFFYDDPEYQSNVPPNQLIKSFNFSVEYIEVTYTGEYYTSPISGNKYELIKFDCLLPTPISLSNGNGWISIQSYNDTENDQFLWMTGSGGDNFSYQENGLPIIKYDVSLCFYRLDESPDKPTITGKLRGKTGKEYEYTIVSTDPEGDNIEYCIDWGDNTGEVCIGPYPSGFIASAKHAWSEKDDYIIKVKARDVYGAESDWTSYEVSMPKIYFYKPITQLLMKISERFPFFEKILNRII